MRLYEIKYSSDFFPEKVPRQLANEAELVFEDRTVCEYQTEIEEIGLKKYIYDKEKENLIITAQASRKYILYCSTLVVIVLSCWFTNVLTGLFRDATLLLGGVMSIIFGWTSLYLPKSQPDFIYLGKNPAKVSRLPYYRQVDLTVSRIPFLLLIFGLVAAWPWIMPNFSLVSFLILITLLFTIYVITRTSPEEQTAPALLFLLVLTGLPVWISVGNLVVFTQHEEFRQQGVDILRIIQEPLFSEYTVHVYEAFSAYNLIYILISNLILMLFGIYYIPKILDRINIRLSTKTNVDNVSYNKRSHLVFLLLYLIYFISSIVVIISYLSGNPIIRFHSRVEFAAIFGPSLAISLYFIYHRYMRYSQIRKQVLSHATKQSRYDFGEDIDIVTVEGLDATAFSVDLAFAKERIVMDREIFELLDSEELAAVYYHELYHIDHQTKHYQQFVNTPIVGPIFFLAFINPEEVCLEEFRADEYAAEEVGVEAVISAIETVAEVKQPIISPHNSVFDASSIQNILKLITTVPIVGIFRPTRRQRIQNLKE